MNFRKSFLKTLSRSFVLFGLINAVSAFAQSYPDRPVTIVNPFVAGGAFDVVARLVAERMTKLNGVQFIVDNKPGAGGTLGGKLVSTARPDGYTLLLSGTGPISIAPAVYKKMDYDPSKALEPIIQLTSSPFVLVTNDAFNKKDVKEFIEFLRNNPNKYNYASTGNGTLVHLAGAYFGSLTGAQFEHVPYGGGSQATLSLLRGDTLFSITNIPNVLSQIESKKLNALATTGPKRSLALPNLPTLKEAGIPEFELVGWIGIFAPAGTPQSIVEKLNSDFAKVMADPALKERLLQQGDEVSTGSVDDFRKFLVSSGDKWQSIAKSANISID